jgi:outer membrane protein insertion porin family
LRYKLDETQIELDLINGDPDLFPVPTPTNPNPAGNPNGITSSLTVTLEYDKRNDRFAPTKGLYGSASLEYAGLGGDKRYTKGLFTGRFYEKLWWELVFRNNLSFGFVRSNDPLESPPYNELFLLGGANSLRGFEWYSIGKKKRSEKRYQCLIAATPPEGCPARIGGPLSAEEAESRAWLPFGGTQQFYYQAELEFPLISEAGIKGVLFYDIGQAEDVLILSELRQDVGFGFRWFSPIGPLRFEWGFPLQRKIGEDSMNFQFAIGSPF